MSSHDDDLARELFFGEFSGALLLFEEVSAQVVEVRAMPGEFSYSAARSFAERLILDPTVDAARRRIESDRARAVSFYEVAHYVSDMSRDRRFQFVRQSDGQHEPFLLLASAVLNQIDSMEGDHPEKIQ
jgi:hypothetical protein